jgi:hypothetical protein
VAIGIILCYLPAGKISPAANDESMIAETLLPLVLLVAQVTPAPMQPAMPPAAAPLIAGQCLDAPRPVPNVLQAPVTAAMQIVRIDKVESTHAMMPGEVIGFLYTLGDGSTWLGQRTADFMSPADATEINQVLGSTHMPGQNVSEFPPQSKYGVPTKYSQFFRVILNDAAATGLKVQVVPCVVWPPGERLPAPKM